MCLFEFPECSSLNAATAEVLDKIVELPQPTPAEQFLKREDVFENIISLKTTDNDVANAYVRIITAIKYYLESGGSRTIAVLMLPQNTMLDDDLCEEVMSNLVKEAEGSDNE